MGPFHETEHGNRYIFTATDYYTKWVEAFPIPNKTAVEVSKCLKKILYRHGAVNAILTDQGREFMNQVNEHLCEEWKIKHKVTAAYHPQTNGLDERTNQTIKRALSKYVNEHQTDWDEWLDEVLFSLRTKPQSSTKYSPFFLLYGREAIYPSQLTQYFELEAGPPDCVSETALEEDLIRREADTEVVREKVRMNTEKAKAKQQVDFKRASQGKRKFKDISVGDRVLKFNSQRAGKKSKGDLNNNYSGPYIVSELNGNCARLMTIDKTHLKSKVNINHLKLFISEEEPETGEKASTENGEGRENTAAEGTNHEASYLLECVNSFIQEGVISQLLESVRNFKVAKPMSVRHSDDLLSCCPVYSFVSKMTNKYDDEIQIVARELLPTLRTENLSLSDKRDLTIILSCLCYQASKLHVSPMLLVGTLMNVPDHLSPVTDTAILKEEERVTVAGETIDTEDLISLDGQNWVNDKVVNAFLNLQKVEKNKGSTHVFVLPSYLAVLWLRGAVTHWLFTKVKFQYFEKILLPICDQHHWILLTVSPKQRQVTIYDSLERNNTRYFEMWRAFIEERNKVCDEIMQDWTYQDGKSNRQEDKDSCGVFVMMNAEAVINEVPVQVMRQVHCKMYRTYVKKILVCAGQRQTESTCDYPECNRANTEWIRCDCCGRWIHFKCGNIPAIARDSAYTCIFCVAMYC